MAELQTQANNEEFLFLLNTTNSKDIQLLPGAMIKVLYYFSLNEGDNVAVVNFYRFEGISDPDDMSIIYAITTSDGKKGTVMDAFGIHSNDNVGSFFDKVKKIKKQTKTGWSEDDQC